MSMADFNGKQIDNYHLIRRLGTGAFGEVYLGENIYDSEQVAIKVLKIEPTQETLKEFLNEARTFRLKHPNIIPLLDFGIDGETPFLVMAYAPKGTLRQRHPSGTRLPLETVIAYARPITAALQYAHEKRLVHRDVKPSNMLLGSHDEILLSDFGIAVVAHSEHSLSTKETLGGTIPYMAPEQIKGKPRPASDQYALGIVVYEWLCGERPFHGPDWSIINQHLSSLPMSLREKNPAIPFSIEEVVLRALSKDPQDRYHSIQDFARALEEASKASKIPTQQLIHNAPRSSDQKKITTANNGAKAATPLARIDNTGTSARVGRGGVAPALPRIGNGANMPPRNTPPPPLLGGGQANRRRNSLLLWLVTLITALLIFGGILVFAHPGSSSNGNNNPFSNAFKGQTLTTVTIIPASKTVQDNYIIIGASSTNAQSRQVTVRMVLGSAQGPTVAVKATGYNAHPFAKAHGTLTFFNSLSFKQMVAAGTVFTVNGVQVVNDEAANIPAANIPTAGFVSVGAHAITTGTAGNIGAGVLNRACCGNGILVRNDTFTGGQDAVNYTFLLQSDVNEAISQGAKDTAKQNALANLQKQFRSGEQQTGATQYTPTISVDQPIGDKGSNVSSANVTYLVKCTATVYDYQGAQNIVQNQLKAKASSDPGPNYVLVGAIQTSVTGQTNTGNVLSLFFSAKGIWIYQFTDPQKLQLANAITGKSIADTQNILNTTPGVGSTRINYSGGNTLPTDPNQISIVSQPIAGLPSTGNGAPNVVVGSPTTTAPTVQSGTPPAGNGKGGANPSG